MNNYEHDYFNLLNDVLVNGRKSENRTGINTYKVWGRQTRINLKDGFPILTTKKLHWRSIVHELLWMISGDTNIRYLLQNGVTFWTEWPYQRYLKSNGSSDSTSVSSFESSSFSQKEFEQSIINNEEFAKQWGSIGEYGYGGLWRRFPARKWQLGADMSFEEDNIYVDQLSSALNDLKTNPDSRRIIISAWHPYHSNRTEDALLPACHNYVQFGTEELTVDEQNRLLHEKCWPDGKPFTGNGTENERKYHKIPTRRLNCYYSMRSNDAFLGKPYNDSFYALLTHLIAHEMNMETGTLVASVADFHLYENHIEQAKLQLSRSIGDLPTLKLKRPSQSIFDVKFEDLELIGYNPQPNIKASVAV